jgi:hypothetical protein
MKHPKCAINDTCNGSFFTCNSNCPPPPLECKLCQGSYCPNFDRMGTGTTSSGASCVYNCDYWKLGLPNCNNTAQYCRRYYCSTCGPTYIYYWG